MDTSPAKVAPPPQRNAPCPCGSGLRYKHCHGQDGATTGSGASVPHARTQAPYPGWEKFSAEQQSSLWRTMQDALAAQRAGQLDTACELYGLVVARAPLTFDALHMLGVARFQQGDLDEAEALLRRASDLMPSFEAIRHNLRLLQHRKQENEGLYSATAIIAGNMLRVFGASGRIPATSSPEHFLDAEQLRRPGAIHVVVPGDVLNAAANRNGEALRQQLTGARPNVALWSDLTGELPSAGVRDAIEIDQANGEVPRNGTLALFGVNARTLTWLPSVAATFDTIAVGLDAHDPMTCVELIDQLPASALPRLRLVARSPEMLADLGLPGAVDPMVFGAVSGPVRRSRAATSRARIGVFIPSLRGREDKARWAMLEWLRARGQFLRLMYPGRLPSRHIEDDEEHLISLVTDWQDWWHDLDALFFWGAEGRMRQFDRLVFEAAAAGLAIVADGFGDYGAALAGDPRCHLFFDIHDAQGAMDALLSALPTSDARMVAHS
jgi:SEC-C motif